MLAQPLASLGLIVINKNTCLRTLLSSKNCKTNLIVLQIIYDSVLGHIHSYPRWQGAWGLCWAGLPGICSLANPFAKVSSPLTLPHSTWNSAEACPQELSCPGQAVISSEACQGSLP